MVVDFALPDMSGFDLLERLKIELGLYDLPIIVDTARELTPREETRLRRLSESIIIKNAQSPERLLAETSLFLHRASAKLPPEKRKMLEEEQKVDPALNRKKVLVIDDDARNIFSLTSLLEGQYMEVLFAENGRKSHESRPRKMHGSGCDRLRVQAGGRRSPAVVVESPSGER